MVQMRDSLEKYVWFPLSILALIFIYHVFGQNYFSNPVRGVS